MTPHDYKALASRKRHKYGAKRTQAPDGTWFASKAECARYLELSLLKRAGMIKDLQIQPRFKLEANGEHIAVYVGDFSYVRTGDPGGRLTVEDVKGVRTDVFKLKQRLMKVLLGLDVVEVSKPKRDVGDVPKRKRTAKTIY